MRQIVILSLIACLAASAGCNVCCWGKRASELGSPTDIRKAHFWCLGEDAIFEQPCGPSKEDYGLKSTCWREWPADGGRCQPGTCPPGASCDRNGNCGPAMLPTMTPRHATPPAWEGATPTEVIEGPNPFLDDESLDNESTLPAPTSSGSLPRDLEIKLPSADSSLPRPAPQRPKLGIAAPKVRTETKPILPPAVVPTITLSPPANRSLPVVTTPTTFASPTASRADGANQVRRLKIAVSEPIDISVQTMGTVPPSKSPLKSNDSQRPRPRSEAETLAGLERMVEVPAVVPVAGSEPLVVRNDFAPQPKSFRLATRKSATKAARDPAVEKQTLSALESMIASDSEPGTAK